MKHFNEWLRATNEGFLNRLTGGGQQPEPNFNDMQRRLLQKHAAEGPEQSSGVRPRSLPLDQRAAGMPNVPLGSGPEATAPQQQSKVPDKWIYNRHGNPTNLLNDFPAGWTPEDKTAYLRKLVQDPPRLPPDTLKQVIARLRQQY